MASAKKGGLGKGLNALISSSTDLQRPLAPSQHPKALEYGSLFFMINPPDVRPNPTPPTHYFDSETRYQNAAPNRTAGHATPLRAR